MAILKKAFQQNLASAPLAEEFEFQYDVEIVQILFNSSVDITEDLSVSYIDTEYGTNYNVLIRNRSLNSESSAAFLEINFRLRKGDKIKIQCTNANTTGVIYGTLQVEAK